MEEIIKKLKVGYVMELAKPDIDKFERAKLIKEVMKEEGMSIRGFTKHFGFKLGTVAGWLKWDKLGEEKYNEYKKKGFNESEITEIVKSSSMKPKNIKSEKEMEFEVKIISLMEYIKKHRFEITPELKQSIENLKKKLDYLLFKYGD